MHDWRHFLGMTLSSIRVKVGQGCFGLTKTNRGLCPCPMGPSLGLWFKVMALVPYFALEVVSILGVGHVWSKHLALIEFRWEKNTKEAIKACTLCPMHSSEMQALKMGTLDSQMFWRLVLERFNLYYQVSITLFI